MFPLIENTFIDVRDRLFRLAVFQASAHQGCLEKIFLSLHSFFSRTPLFDENRAQRGLEALKALGAEFRYVNPKDGQATIHMMEMRSDDLEKKLSSFGAKWERIFSKRDQREILAIFPPDEGNVEWEAFEKLLTGRLKWDKRKIENNEYGTQEMIVTCEWAESIDDSSWHQKLFLYSNAPATHFVMHMRRLGIYLGCKQSVCFYDPRNDRASEGAHYNDIEAVYNSLGNQFAPQDTWVSGTCGGAFAAAHLKAKFHYEGINLILENAPFSVRRDFIEPQCCLVKKCAEAAYGSLYARNLPTEHKPPEYGFEMEGLLSGLHQNDSTVIVVGVRKDPLLPDTVHEELVALAEKGSSNVRSIKFESNKKGHSDNYFEHPEPLAQVISAIFAS